MDPIEVLDPTDQPPVPRIERRQLSIFVNTPGRRLPRPTLAPKIPRQIDSNGTDAERQV
jgi:hypothetical protein